MRISGGSTLRTHGGFAANTQQSLHAKRTVDELPQHYEIPAGMLRSTGHIQHRSGLLKHRDKFTVWRLGIHTSSHSKGIRHARQTSFGEMPIALKFISKPVITHLSHSAGVRNAGGRNAQNSKTRSTCTDTQASHP